MFAEQYPLKLSETVGRIVKHRQNRQPIGKRERNLRLPRDQRSLDRVRLMLELAAAQPPDQLKRAVVGDVSARRIIVQRSPGNSPWQLRAP